MTERSLDELGPVDYLVVEFPAGHQNFTGEAAEELLRLHDAGMIRVMDLVLIGKGPDGTVMAQELGDLADIGRARPARDRAGRDPGGGGRREVRRGHGAGLAWAPCSSTRTCGPPSSRPPSATPAASSSPTAGSPSRPSSPRSRPTRPSRQKESDMPLRPVPRRQGRGRRPRPSSPAPRPSPRLPSSAPPCHPAPRRSPRLPSSARPSRPAAAGGSSGRRRRAPAAPTAPGAHSRRRRRRPIGAAQPPHGGRHSHEEPAHPHLGPRLLRRAGRLRLDLPGPPDPRLRLVHDPRRRREVRAVRPLGLARDRRSGSSGSWSRSASGRSSRGPGCSP